MASMRRVKKLVIVMVMVTHIRDLVSVLKDYWKKFLTRDFSLQADTIKTRVMMTCNRQFMTINDSYAFMVFTLE